MHLYAHRRGRTNLLQVVKAGDRIIIVGEKNLAAQPVPLDEIADYVKGCQRPFNMYIHRPARENSGPVTISLLDDSEDEIDVPGDNCANQQSRSLTGKLVDLDNVHRDPKRLRQSTAQAVQCY